MISPVGTDKIDGKLFNLGEKVTEKPARMTNSAIYNLIRNNVFDCSKAKGEMDFHTHPFAESIVDTIEWPK